MRRLLRPLSLGAPTLAIGLALGLAALTTTQTHGQTTVAAAPGAGNRAELVNWSRSVWSTANKGDAGKLSIALDALPDTDADASLRESVDRLKTNLAQREETRLERAKELSEELDKTLAGATTDIQLGKSLRSAVELELIATDRAAFLKQPRIISLIRKADAAAKAAEVRGDWMVSSELFVRLHALLEESGTYRKDQDRVTQRLGMLRTYVPQRLWELRNQRQLAAGEDALPPYNPLGDDYNTKLRGIDKTLLLRVLNQTPAHVEQVPTQQILIGGLEAVKVMATTTDLAGAFPALANGDQVATFTNFIDKQISEVRGWEGPVDSVRQYSLLSRVAAQSESTLKIPETALLHEFGNGMMTQLDDFSAIIWPDEMRRFERNTQGKLVGIGVSIEFDPQSNIKVVSPLEGTPAQRVGIHAGDIIKKVDGAATYGMSLDQAVEVITGPPNTQVVITVDREIEDGADAEGKPKTKKQEIDFTITRMVIDLKTVRGWKRNGVKEDDWDWFIDKDSGIGYVRLTQFTDGTTRELDRAITQMQATGLNGLVFDLRFNPGGLLDQAVEVVRRFVDVEHGAVVMMSGPGGMMDQPPEFTRPAKARLAKTPVVCLINENSASASEIVSGALRFYGMTGGPDGQPAIKCLVLGERSFGKGSVQNVFRLGNGMMKLTIQYYMLPDKSIIHRKLGAEKWGIEPQLRVDMLPKQTTDALTLRRNADVMKLDENGAVAVDADKAPNPDDLLTKGIDVQLETALVLLKSQAAASTTSHVRADNTRTEK